MKHLRSKKDGWVYTFNENLASRDDMEVFEWGEDVPEKIEDLYEFLNGQKATEPVARRGRPKKEAQPEAEQ